MVFDVIENFGLYFRGSAADLVREFLLGLGTDAALGNYDLRGEDVFARVMRYETKRPEEAVLEAHREYADVQCVLAGEEAVEWHSRLRLAESAPYDDEKDAVFFVRPSGAPARLELRPGYFAVFFPDDAHMQQLMVAGTPGTVLKAVLKVRVGLLADVKILPGA